MTESTVNQREKCIIVAEIMKNANRPQTVIGLMEEAIRYDPKLNPNERNLVVRPYKAIIKEKRESLSIVVQSIEKETLENPASPKLGKLRTLRNKIQTELNTICDEFLDLLDSKLLPNSIDDQAKIFYWQAKADVFRYLCESCDDKNKENYIEKATESYNQALNLCQESYEKNHPNSLRLRLNYCVFLYEILNKTNEAISLLEALFLECTKEQDDPSDKNFTERHILLQMILDNIAFWQKGNAE